MQVRDPTQEAPDNSRSLGGIVLCVHGGVRVTDGERRAKPGKRIPVKGLPEEAQERFSATRTDSGRVMQRPMTLRGPQRGATGDFMRHADVVLTAVAIWCRVA